MVETEPQNSSQKAILQPLRTDCLPEPATDAPLFLPADAQRVWYLGFLEHWTNFEQHAINFWNSQDCKSAFDEIKDCEVEPPRTTTASSTSNDGPERVKNYFQREVLQVVEKVYNKLLTTTAMRELNDGILPEHIELISIPFLADDDSVPRLFGLTTNVHGEDVTRFTGEVEYLGGKPGALTWAIEEAAKNTWGSLRCVLGDIAEWMLESDTCYSFVMSSDEIVFLRLDIDTRTHCVNTAPPKDLPYLEDVDVAIEPRLYFSDPIKYAYMLDEAEGTISVRMAVMFLVHTVLTKEWLLPENKGPSSNYFGTTDVGERYKLPYPKSAALAAPAAVQGWRVI